MSLSRVFVLFVALVACIAAAGGCATSDTYDKETYLLDVSRPAGPAAAPVDATLSVQRFTVDPAFAERSLVYRLDEFKYEPDFYRQFLVTPSQMITEQTRRWLADSGVFAQVLPRGSRLQTAYSLEGSVTALYGDFRDGAAPVGILEIRFFLLRRAKAGQTVAFTKTYRAARPIQIRTPEVLIDALSKNLIDILTRFEADLSQSLAAKPAQPTALAP